jgi:hypothetical protein
VPPSKAARSLHLTVAEFTELRPRVEQRGFPLPDPDTGMYDMKAIDMWMDRRSGLAGLTGGLIAHDASAVVAERLRSMRG